MPADHPLRPIKRRVEAVLQKLSPLCDKLYAAEGRESIPPEQRLKARVLTALYSGRRERLFCEQPGYNLLWLGFLDREFSEGRFNHSVFANNDERGRSADVAKLFFAEINDTHPSTTDPESVRYRKASGKEAKLGFGAPLLLENRHGLGADFTLHNPITEAEPVLALQQLDKHTQLPEGRAPQTVGADKNDPQKGFGRGGRAREISPHGACKDGVAVAGLDGRATAKAGYQTSQRIRKRVEEIIGWIKTVGGLRRSRSRGRERTQAWGYFVAGTYNLLRLARLELARAD